MKLPRRVGSRSVFEQYLSNRLFYLVIFALLAAAVLVYIASGQSIYIVRCDNQYALYTGIAGSPEDVFRHVGIELHDFDEVEIKDGNIISKIDVIRAYPVKLVTDGVTRTVHTTGETVGAILERMGVTLGNYDAVSPEVSTIPIEDAVITVSRGSVEYVEESVRLYYKTIEVESDDYYVGTSIRTSAGHEGEAVRKYAMIYRDGELVSRELVEETVLSEAVDEYRIVGTHLAAQSSARLTVTSTQPAQSTPNTGSAGKPSGSGSGSSSSGSGSSSSGSSSGSGSSGSGSGGSSSGSGSGSGSSGSGSGGNDSTKNRGFGGQDGTVTVKDNGDGTGVVTTVGGSKLKYIACYAMQATAYNDNMTALGNKPSWGTVAVDKSVISLRSKIYICNKYYTWQYCELATAGDVGVIGQRVDLWMTNETMCYKFGRRPVWVYLIKKG